MPAEGTGTAKTALIVDDEPEVRRLIVMILSRHGYRTIQADSGLEALSAAQQGVDVLVTDFSLPDIDGTTLAGRFIARFPDVGVVFMSGFVEVPRLQLEKLSVRWVFLPKPFRMQELLEAVRSVVTKTGGERAA
jgi:CheY-like chemotaxis protein